MKDRITLIIVFLGMFLTSYAETSVNGKNIHVTPPPPPVIKNPYFIEEHPTSNVGQPSVHTAEPSIEVAPATIDRDSAATLPDVFPPVQQSKNKTDTFVSDSMPHEQSSAAIGLPSIQDNKNSINNSAVQSANTSVKSLPEEISSPEQDINMQEHMSSKANAAVDEDSNQERDTPQVDDQSSIEDSQTEASILEDGSHTDSGIEHDDEKKKHSELSDPIDKKDDDKSQDESRGARILKGADFEHESDSDATESDDRISLDGVDTAAIKGGSTGNWLEKKHYWGQIEEVVDSVKDTLKSVFSSRVSFFEMRSEVDKELESFYVHVGLDQGPLQDMIQYALDIMAKEKDHQGYLNRKERAFYEKVQAKQRVFEQLKDDVKAIATLDIKIDEALEVVLQQINKCNEYEAKVWNIYKTVSYELSEKEAERNYLVAKAYLKDIENIQSYFNGAFSTYFTELTNSLQSHTQSILAQLDSLEQEGISLKHEAMIFETPEEGATIESSKKHEVTVKSSEEPEEAHKEVVVRKEIKRSFIQRMMQQVYDLMTVVKDFFGHTYDAFKQMIFGTSQKSATKNVSKEMNEQHEQHEAYVRDEQSVAESHMAENAHPNETHETSEENTFVKDMHSDVERVSDEMDDQDKKVFESIEYDKKGFEHEMDDFQSMLKNEADSIVHHQDKVEEK